MKTKSIAIFLAFAIVALLPGCGSAFDAAGVIAYSRIQGETYVLLADHIDSDRGWGTFGGTQEEGETLSHTARREFREETRCVYDLISDDDLSEEPSVSQNRFLSYVVEVSFVPAQVFESKPATADCRGQDFEERGPWVWIPLDELMAVLEEGDVERGFTLPESYVPAGATTRLWSDSATILQKALQSRYLQ